MASVAPINIQNWIAENAQSLEPPVGGKPVYTDTGDFVVVLNADKVRFTGKKETDKVYYRHTGYVGGIKSITPEAQRERHPERIVHAAVRGMLPKGPLGRRLLKKLKIYNGTEHPHGAQQPKPLN